VGENGESTEILDIWVTNETGSWGEKSNGGEENEAEKVKGTVNLVYNVLKKWGGVKDRRTF